MTRHIQSPTVRQVGPLRLLAVLITVGTLATALGVPTATAQTAPAAEGLRYVPHGTGGRHEIARDARGYQAGTLRPIPPAGQARPRSRVARTIAMRTAATVATGAMSKVIVPVVVVAGGALIIRDLASLLR